MSIFVDNINTYIAANKIKQSYIALKTEMNVNKVSRILKGAQSATEDDMERISAALGHRLDYFLSPKFNPEHQELMPEQLAFYSGDIESVTGDTITDCISLLEHIHSILGREQTILNQMNEELYADY